MTLILCKAIEVTNRREEPEGRLTRLMESLTANGLLQPIVVVEHPETPKRFVMLAGRRRLAAATRLGWKKIEASILDSDDIRNEMVMITENFDRLELTTIERDLAGARYAELVRQLQTANGTLDTPKAKPPPPGAGPAPGKRDETARRERGAVVTKVAEDFGVSTRTAQKVLKRADTLSEEDRRMLDLRGVRDNRLDRVVAIKDPEQRAHVIEAISEGVSFTDAMMGVLGKDFVRGEDDLSPAEWLATLPLNTKPVNQERFRSDALLYRRIQKLKIGFANDVNWSYLKSEFSKEGIFFRRLLFLLDCPHPREWILCGGCTEGIQNGRDHLACRGGGFLLS